MSFYHIITISFCLFIAILLVKIARLTRALQWFFQSNEFQDIVFLSYLSSSFWSCWPTSLTTRSGFPTSQRQRLSSSPSSLSSWPPSDQEEVSLSLQNNNFHQVFRHLKTKNIKGWAKYSTWAKSDLWKSSWSVLLEDFLLFSFIFLNMFLIFWIKSDFVKFVMSKKCARKFFHTNLGS